MKKLSFLLITLVLLASNLSGRDNSCKIPSLLDGVYCSEVSFYTILNDSAVQKGVGFESCSLEIDDRDVKFTSIHVNTVNNADETIIDTITGVLSNDKKTIKTNRLVEKPLIVHSVDVVEFMGAIYKKGYNCTKRHE